LTTDSGEKDEVQNWFLPSVLELDLNTLEAS
jgi:hypothetical protein